MIARQKVQPALYSIHAILVRVRNWALRGQVDQAKLADIMDWAEIMPALIESRTDDTTEEFRSMLIGLGKKHPEFAGLIENFDRNLGWHDPATTETTCAA